ncbi:putative bacterial regulatory helix-turn-helix protein, AraC family [Escherichia coli TA054]|uniref:helix-turn-helix transcriptional regulator n=1 Tax=Escherichia coli TaxID=562 RepID=UPI000A187F27|nr:helix-turn-helix transcriptional regulator [Escherichia coli]OSL66226.1 putative bacterial regulatory helix-turn-helix protein, AraC family [Escherichia coli TA054]
MGIKIQKMMMIKILECIDGEVESGQRMDIDTLCAYSGYSRRHLQRLFLAETGICLGEYIRRRRLSRAALLLRLSLRRITDIAYSVGFDSQQSFSREFKKNTGFTPKQYRSHQEWILSPLFGHVHVFFDISAPEVVYLPGGVIVGDEIAFLGRFDFISKNASFNEYLDQIFTHSGRELWMIAQVCPINHQDFHCQIIGGWGTPERKEGEKFSYSAGKYLKVTFETNRETHVMRTNFIYMNILPRNNSAIKSDAEVLTFKYDGGKVICSLFIPVV